MHATATVNGTVIADTDKYEIVEGNVYFPPESLNQEFFKKTDTHSACPWKGNASYYTIDAGGKSLKDAAWYYPQPFDKAQHIKDHVAFCRFFQHTCAHFADCFFTVDKTKVDITSE
jgi:uncharacterized protein (DUF427 family)